MNESGCGIPVPQGSRRLILRPPISVPVPATSTPRSNGREDTTPTQPHEPTQSFNPLPSPSTRAMLTMSVTSTRTVDSDGRLVSPNGSKRGSYTVYHIVCAIQDLTWEVDRR